MFFAESVVVPVGAQSEVHRDLETLVWMNVSGGLRIGNRPPLTAYERNARLLCHANAYPVVDSCFCEHRRPAYVLYGIAYELKTNTETSRSNTEWERCAYVHYCRRIVAFLASY